MSAAEHFGNPLVEQRSLLAGKAIIALADHSVIQISGPDRLNWLHDLLSQDFKNLKPGASTEALLLDPQGHIEADAHAIDDGESVWLICEAAQRDQLLAWLSKMIFRTKVTVRDVTDDFAVVAKFESAAPAFISNDISLSWHDNWPKANAGGIRYATNSGAAWNYFESIVARSDLASVLAQFESAGTLALDALRVAAFRPAAAELDAKTLPHELDLLSTAVHLTKGCYRGQETVAKVHNLGHPPRRLTFLHLDGNNPVLPVAGDEIFVAGEERARGRITSSAQHFEMGPIALAVLSRGVAEDAPLEIRTASGIAVANQEVIVPQSAGSTRPAPKRNLLMGGGH